MNNGKAFPSLDGTATCDMTSCSFYQALASQKVLDFLRPAKTQFIRKESSNKRKNVKSQIKNKKDRSKVRGISEIISYQFWLISLDGANHEQPSQNN